MAVRTGFNTTKGSIKFVSMLFPKPSGFKFYRDSFRYISVMAGIAALGFVASFVKAFVRLKLAWHLIIVRAAGSVAITIVVPPALPATLSIGTNFALSRLRKNGGTRAVHAIRRRLRVQGDPAPAGSRQAILATPMSMAANSTRRCWISTCRSDSNPNAVLARRVQASCCGTVQRGWPTPLAVTKQMRSAESEFPPMASRMMTLVAFLQAQNCSNLPGSWRHPATMLDFTTPEYYQRIARMLEDGKIQMAFFDDRLALPDLYTGNHAEAIAAGVRAVKMDPSTILMMMGMVTQRLGLGVTYSTTYYEPFHVARLFATMDLMLKGRAAWNIVTSLNRGEAPNFGSDEHMGHDARYDRAEEFMEVVLGHWNSWEDDALILDKAENRFADPAKVHRLDHAGNVFPLARPVQRAALAARPSGTDPGRANPAAARPSPRNGPNWYS